MHPSIANSTMTLEPGLKSNFCQDFRTLEIEKNSPCSEFNKNCTTKVQLVNFAVISKPGKNIVNSVMIVEPCRVSKFTLDCRTRTKLVNLTLTLVTNKV